MVGVGELRCTGSSRGLLIAIEGIDGSGKTTISRMVEGYLSNLGLKTIYTAEPTDGPVGRIIKERVFKAEERVDPYLEALLFAADRRYHVIFEIEPALKEGYIVVCDRYVHSSIAYQGALGAPTSWVEEVNSQIVKPDVAIYIDVLPEVGLKRKGEVRVATFENIEYLEKVRRIYLELVSRGELILVDGSRRVDEVFREVLDVLEPKISSSS